MATLTAGSLAAKTFVNPGQGFHSLGCRMLAVDEGGFASGGIIRNTNFNPFVQYNFRATRFSRNPYDGFSQTRSAWLGSGGIFQYETNPVIFSELSTNPLLSKQDVSSAERFTTVDLPRREWGVYSIAQLQHAPLTVAAWQPALAVGNSFASPCVESDRSAVGLTQEYLDWAFALRDCSGGLPSEAGYIANYPTVKAATGGSDEPLFIFDAAFELNNELFDRYCASGMRADSGVRGWNRGEVWAPDATNSTHSRYVSTGRPQGAPSPLYAAAAGMMIDGAFNVNSTSEAAWVALLSSARGVSVPAVGGGKAGDAAGTPYSHVTTPVLGKAATSASRPENPESWAGARILTDDEIRKLARRLVREVKERGPFLSLADFVNRRLKKTDANSDYRDFVGALQAAIDGVTREDGLINAGLRMRNISREPDAATLSGDPVNNQVDAQSRFTSVASRAANRVDSKTVGAPGCLTQADVLQSVGHALSARSDTFTIRAVGHDENGSPAAAVELVVQRQPEALRPKNPQRNGNIVIGDAFGRRFTVVKTRWMSVDEL